MNVGDERSISCWMDQSPVLDAPQLAQDETCDVIVIGAGIAGLSTAYELARLGRSVVVIDRGGIGNGMTARTTAHLATELDDFYSELIKVRGEEEARIYYDSQVAAVNRIEAICREESIDADFARLDGYLFPAEESHIRELKDEFEACRKLGVDCEWLDNYSLPGREVGPAIRFPNQGRFHPTKYLKGLAQAILGRGGRIYADTVHISDEENEGGVEITTEAGPVIRARDMVFLHQLTHQREGGDPPETDTRPDLCDRRPSAERIGARRADVGHAGSLSLCPHPAGRRDRGSADRRWRGPPGRRSQ
jgi:voltage-gated potassium channel Kch